jgi:hypothetical protein
MKMQSTSGWDSKCRHCPLALAMWQRRRPPPSASSKRKGRWLAHGPSSPKVTRVANPWEWMNSLILDESLIRLKAGMYICGPNGETGCCRPFPGAECCRHPQPSASRISVEWGHKGPGRFGAATPAPAPYRATTPIPGPSAWPGAVQFLGPESNSTRVGSPTVTLPSRIGLRINPWLFWPKYCEAYSDIAGSAFEKSLWG